VILLKESELKNLLLIGLLFLGTQTIAAPVKLTGFGIGIMIGDPTAFAFKGYLGNDRYFDIALGNDSGPADGVYLHSDYIIEKPEQFEIQDEKFNLYYGIGGRAYTEDTKKHKDEFHLGIRVPVGINYYFKEPSVEVFAEAAAIMELTPETAADLDFSIGARYWF
jgi:hypothetical protein